MSDRKYTRKTIPVYEEDYNQFRSFILTKKNGKITGKHLAKEISKAFYLYQQEEEHKWIEKVNAINLDDIFSYRRNPNEIERLRRAYEEAFYVDHSTICMIGISLKDFFLRNGIFHPIISKSIDDFDVYYKIIILNPRSRAANFRIEIEQGKIEKSESQLYIDILNVARELNNPSKKTEKERKRVKNHFDVRFADEPLSCYLVQTRDYTFIENYHSGRTSGIDEDPIHKRDQICLGGYVPYLKVRNKGSMFANIISSHFDILFKRYEENTLINTIKEITNR